MEIGEPVIVVIGPTAAGKSAFALALAERFGGAILNADAMQVYRGFDRGTSKPSAAERACVPHFLIDIADPRRPFSAGDFVRAADSAAATARARGLRPILVGGTGLYVRAYLRGLFHGPRRDPEVRARLERRAKRRGPDSLHRLLARLDPPTASRVAPRDRQRVVRALEVRLRSGRPLSAHHGDERGGLWQAEDRVGAVKIGLAPPRSELVEKIKQRVAAFYAGGLVEEVRSLLAAGIPAVVNAFKGIGYREALAVVRGEMDETEATRLTLVATRQYAKRQMTWFRRERNVHWFRIHGDEPALVEAAAPLIR